jgi:hypothetical protein
MIAASMSAWISDRPPLAAVCAGRITCSALGTSAASALTGRDTTGSEATGAEPAAVAAHLGISRDAVYNWVSCGHLRRGTTLDSTASHSRPPR